MSALRDAMSHAALGWVKPELDETLRQARNEIEYFAEEPSDTSRMRFCAGYLHQVQGTLRMVELYAPAMVAEELELLAQAVQVGEVADRDEACAMLMRGTVLLPDYLERLQNGHRDIPIVLLPLLNEIRATRGQPGLSESVLFAFDPQAGVATEAELDHARGSLSGRNRELLDTVGNAVKEELLRVKDALDLHLRTGGEIAELQTQVKDLGSVADTLGMMGLGVARNVVVQQRDALARVVDGQVQMDEGVLLDIAGALLYVDASLDDQVASLGADVGDGNEASNSATSSEVRRTVDVLAQEAIANFGAAREHFVAFIETNWDHARLTDVPHLLGEVGGALRILELPQAADYLEGVRRYVDLELIGKQRVPSGRQLDTLADAMASLEYYLEALRERRPGREEILDITRNSLETLRYWPLPSGQPSDLPVGADQPGSVAEPLAASLAQQAAAPALAANDAAPTPSLEWANETVVEAPFAASVVHDTGAAATDTVFSFDPVAAEETVSGQAHVPFTVAPLDLSDDGAQAPGDWQLETTEHAAPIATSVFDPVSAEQDGSVSADAAQVSYTVDLSALEQDDSATPAVAEPAPLQIEQIELPGDADQTEAPLDFIAQAQTGRAQTSIEDAFSPPPLPPVAPQELDDPFVESAPEPQPAPADDAAEQSAPRVQQAVVSEFELDAASTAFLAQLDAAAAQFDVQRPQVQQTTDADSQTAKATPEPAVSEPVQASVDAGIFGGFGDSDIDDDIRDVFLEEFDEELVNLGQLLPVWRAAPHSQDNLRPIRRVFHTLKGSGRLVGAQVLGEFSWKIESMLNRVLDNSRPASPAVVAMVELAYEVLPQFNAALRDQGRISADLPDIQAVAERVAAGEEAYYVAAPATPVAADVAFIPAAAGVFAATGGTPASVDSVLREILEAEVATHLETVNAWLQANQAEPQLASEELLRAVHTMSGAFAMTDVPEITLVTTPAESYVKRLLAASLLPSQEGIDAIAATASAIATTVTALRADAPLIPSFAPLTERLRALVETLPEAQWPPQAFLDELEDLDAPGEMAVSSESAVELTGAQDLSQYLDASALPSDTSDHSAPVHVADDAADADAHAGADAAIAVDELAEAEAEDTSSLALDTPAPHERAQTADLAALEQEQVVDSVETAQAPAGDAVASDAGAEQLAEASHGDAAQHQHQHQHQHEAEAESSGVDGHDTPADEPVVDADAWDATGLQQAGHVDAASHAQAGDMPEAGEHVAVDELSDAEAALGDAQTLAAPEAGEIAAERADAEQQSPGEYAAEHEQLGGDASAQDADAVLSDDAASTDEAPVETIEALEAVHAQAPLADHTHAATSEDWTPDSAALDGESTEQGDHVSTPHDEAIGAQAQPPAEEAAQHGDAALPDDADAQLGDQLQVQDTAQLGQHPSSEQHALSGEQVHLQEPVHAHEAAQSEAHVDSGDQEHLGAHAHADEVEHVAEAERAAEAEQATEAEQTAAAEYAADADHAADVQQAAEALAEHTIESVQAFEMAQVADQVEETGDPQSEIAPELHSDVVADAEADTHADAEVNAQHPDAGAGAGADVTLEAANATDAVEHPEQVEHAEQVEYPEHAEQVGHIEQVESTDSASEHEDAAAVAFSAPVEDAAAGDSAASDVGAAFDTGPLNFDQLDGELVDIFVEEGRDLLDHCDGLIARMREVPEDREVLNGLQRDLHTLKGGARMAGINAIGDLGHAIESLLEAVAANRTDIDRDDVRLFERGFDRLHQLLTRTGMHRAVAMPTDLVEAFETRTRGRNAAEPSDADVRAIAKASVEPAPLSAPIPVDGQVEEELLPRAQQEQVRVRADLLDRLVNHAGEVAIYRSRLEQQMGAFRGAMGELDRTNARLRDQLRRLDLETEAQIVARYQREQDQGDRTFDPLELDRFSTLQQLSRALNESAADLGGLQGVLEDLSRQYDGLLQQQSRVSSELQDGLMRARMVPFDGLVPRLRRVVRQAASDTGKQVHLLLEGTQGELDRNVLDRMVAPLEHMLRNSVAHGLEAPEQRRDAGKPEEGSIAIRLRREGSEIVLEVADDGAGLDREAIRRRGEQRGLIEPGQELSEAELDGLIFASGFSTSEQVSQLAGRGVGMDVVRNEVRQLGGSVDIHSVRGQGVTFTLRLPQTLAVTQAVFVRIGDTTFAVPVASVSGIGRISRSRYESGEGGYHYAGEEYVLHDLGSLVGQAAARADGQAQVPLLLVRAGDLRAAVAIDQVLGNREIVVKPVGLQIASVPGIYGATITGDGRVVVILDVAPLVRRYLSQPARPAPETPAESQRQVPLVMVVDDSLTMRKVTSRVLERHNLDVTTARDGVEALELLQERVPDLMLLDIEMPRMDGYELATAMRADPRFKAVPIVMITSRSGEKHRQRAFEIGVQRYLGKPYQELDLMRNVYDLLGIARVRE
ncbi:chemotaxis protein CheY [Xanthomonas arboricola]|uniref:Hpt domain-containing protein n=2 Tax=Xanthomonas arboricola TaxID=56448 RepID=UPI00069DE87B|nr:Hpt domain-containing protein [Xanthomonas arboricola]KOB03782.1 chemotaxis protein CheY [Xanthomonas arboricola]KOB05813.1 chemotaxis protein CheY [Xanthomonas arboricola]KOB17568.1 chemotaxis protein CheY [Xanthomonas arboricola]KOB24065.1 chemotaxis protein CheY [Xanthomonas arboricola]KOB30718.1 chemotaxis protein CheY [Xanthomonas arboricola]